MFSQEINESVRGSVRHRVFESRWTAHNGRGPLCLCGGRFLAPPSLNYVPGPEEPEQAPPSPEFVLEPVYPEFMPSEDEVFPAEEQSLSAAVSPTANSPGYIADSDPEEHEEDPEEDPADYPTDRGDDDDDDDESSDDDEYDDDEYDDDDVEEEKEEEEEEHLAPADSVPPLIHRVARLLAIPTPPPSPLSPLSSPLPQILSPPLPISPPPLPASPTHPLGYRATMIRLRAKSPSTSHLLPSSTPPLGTPPLLPIPLPTSLPPLLLPSIICRAGVFEVTLPPRKRLCIALEHGTPAATDVAGLSQRMTDFVTTVRHDTDEIYVRLDDAEDDRLLMSSQINLLRRDRRAHDRIARLMETEARLSREDWTEIGALRAADHTRQAQLMETLTLMRTLQTQKMAPKRTTRSTPATTITPTTSVTDEQLKRLIDQGVADALAARDADRSQNGEDIHESGIGVRRQAPLTCECTYPVFMKCKPLYFKGTKGVVELTQWFERMETVFRISNCSVENQIKFSTCTLLGSALTWWNAHVRTASHDVAYAMTWTNLKKKIIDKYCPKGEIKKLEVELWNLKVNDTDVISYNQRFQELALMCARMFLEESDKIEKYVGGLPDMIHGSVMASKPKTMQDAIEFATDLMDKKILTFAE
ncbi:putative reverse transcriptase domain-containing protein [Tanacetum coccineum]